MDTWTPEKKSTAARIEEIKAYMPSVYGSIQAKAAEVGNAAYALVRRGLRGEPNCFYAFEGGRVVGTPFGPNDGLVAEAALLMVQFGATHCCMWGAPDGTH